jgi:phage baseplate assembly protein W
MAARNFRRLFTGFSTYDTETTGEWRLYDIALIRRDLLNHFHTRLGERVMRPDFGCRIWEYVMEPMDDANVAEVAAEARRVCEQDTRVAVRDVLVSTLDNGIRVEIELEYTPFGVVDSLAVDFERREESRLGAAEEQ